MNDFLDRMIAGRRQRLRADYGELGDADRERLACSGRPPRDFAEALMAPRSVAIIAEIKKASPSAGPIAEDLEASRQACVYEAGGAAAISVLTEPTAFGGSFADLSDVADAVFVPVLCKDFVVDPMQLFLARGHGADAVLLMVGVLGHDLADYIALAETLGLAALVEVHDAVELEVARRAGAMLVGVNSRDLKDLSVDLDRALALATRASRLGLIVVFESGVKTRDDVIAAAAAGADAVLVGEHLMRAQFPEEAVEDLAGVPKSWAALTADANVGADDA